MKGPVNVPIRETAHCFYVIPTDDMKEKRVQIPKFPFPTPWIDFGSLTLEGSALTNGLPHCPEINYQNG